MKTLQCIYDLAISPCSYDFFAFLLSAETHRIRNQYDNIELVFIPGPKNGFRKDNLRTDLQNKQFFLNVIIPGIDLMPSIKCFHKLNDRSSFLFIKFPNEHLFPRGYSLENPRNDYIMHGIVTARIRDEDPVFFTPPQYAIDSAKKILKNICGDKKPVILTVRELERENNSKMRSIIQDVWQDVINELENSNYKLIVIRDTEAAFNLSPLFSNITELQVASFHLHLRYAIHTSSHISFFKNNGPFFPAFYSDANVVMFNNFDESHTALTERWMNTNFGINFGSQYPMAAKNSIVIWGEETKDVILKHIFEIKFDKVNKTQKWPFENNNDIVLSAQTSINYTLRNMTSGVHLEDLKFFSKIKKYMKDGNINPLNIKQTLLNLEIQKQLPLNTVTNLVELDKISNTKVF
tara:strand:- start:141 stop:1361 length:1221 start_codon:yes stop_codon:yes gene_type:complete